MPFDALDRPARSTVLREHQSVVDAPVADVFAALATALDTGHESTFAADESRGLIVVQGGWWYRAEYRVSADPAGTRIAFSLLNVATPAHWAGPITGRAAVRSAAQDFGALMDRVRSAL